MYSVPAFFLVENIRDAGRFHFTLCRFFPVRNHISYSISCCHQCVCLCVCLRVLGWLSQLCAWRSVSRIWPSQSVFSGRNAATRPVHSNGTPLFLQKPTGETVKRSYLFLLPKTSNSWTQKCAAHWNSKKRKGRNITALQNRASMAENGHKDFLRRYCEDWRSSCSQVSNCHPAKSRVLTTQRARKSTIRFSVASAILTCNGLATLKGLPPGCTFPTFPLLSWWPRTIPQGGRGTPSMNITRLSSPQTALLWMLSNHTRNAHKPWTQCTSCWQGNSAD